MEIADLRYSLFGTFSHFAGKLKFSSGSKISDNI